LQTLLVGAMLSGAWAFHFHSGSRPTRLCFGAAKLARGLSKETYYSVNRDLAQGAVVVARPPLIMLTPASRPLPLRCVLRERERERERELHVVCVCV
jgi:hypothetical protein